MKKYDSNCGYCGIRLNPMRIDHIIPRAFFKVTVANKIQVPDFLKHLTENDVDHIDNLMPCCQSCNSYKSAYHLEEFRYQLSQQLKRDEENSINFRLAKRFGLLKVVENVTIRFYFEGYGK